MQALHKLNIEKKLTLMLVGVCGVSLFLASVLLIGYENDNSREQLNREMNIMSEIISDRSKAALVFHDTDSANSNLATLVLQSNVIYACIRDRQNILFAEYTRNDHSNTSCAPVNTESGTVFNQDSVDIFREIGLDGKTIGMLQIRSDLTDLHQRLMHNILVMLSVSAFALILAILASRKFVKYISGPVINLSSIASSITDSQDFSVRARKYSDDEIGTLVDAFNNMLKHIQYRDEALRLEKNKAEKSALDARRSADETKKINLELTNEIDIRKRVEEKLQELNDNLENRVKERTAELKALNERIGEVARSAGMAEVASGVLHNVGNVLNSINVSSSLIREILRKSKSENLGRVAEMLNANLDNLGEYITRDPKGSRLPEFIFLLSNQLDQERQQLFRELDVLANNIDHIKNVISMQQSYAGSYGVLEHVSVSDLIEDALRINIEGMDRYNIRIEREYNSTPMMYVDKHKILQILINLISNAKHALIDSANPDKLLTLRVTENDAQVSIEVIDNGIGINQEDLARLFEYGFKKRKGGHGYGLHHSALTANSLNGKIVANSDGPGKGASFKLIVPVSG